tara:strand:- start:365 stop:1018 length:654 start_codon:yes stop_codon:yes gene_type:complete
LSRFLTSGKIISLYKKGFFPMAESAESLNINFYKPEKRFIIPIYTFHIPRKLLSEYKKKKYKFSIDNDFENVINNCSLPRKNEDGTWINKLIKKNYIKLNKEGYAHSIECFEKNRLVAGLYGIHIGSCFFGESMFTKKTNGSKLALIYLITLLINNKFTLLDSQFFNSHLLQFGAYEISDHIYQDILKHGLKINKKFPKKLDTQKSISILQSLSHKS